MDEKLKKALECCKNNDMCPECPLISELYCREILTAEAENYITELEERLAIMQESMEALEKRLDDSDRINVVRCSDCIYWQPPTYQEQEDGSTIGHCTAALDGQQTDAYWFCADGTR